MSRNLTKKKLLDEVLVLRDKISRVFDFNEEEVTQHYRSQFHIGDLPSMDAMRRAIIMSATYHLTNVLDVE